MSSADRLDLAADPARNPLVRAVDDATGHLSVKLFDMDFRRGVAFTRWLASRPFERWRRGGLARHDGFERIDRGETSNFDAHMVSSDAPAFNDLPVDRP